MQLHRTAVRGNLGEMANLRFYPRRASSRPLGPIAPATDVREVVKPIAMSLYDALKANAAARGQELAYRAKRRGLWKSWSWSEVEQQVIEIQGILQRVGLGRGDVVAIGGEANPRLYWYLLAVQRAGAVPLLVHSRITPSELADSYSRAEFSIFVGGTAAQADVAVSVRNSCPKLRAVIALDGAVPSHADRGLVYREADLAQSKPAAEEVPPVLASDQTAIIIPTYDEAGDSVLVEWPHSLVTRAGADFSLLTGLKSGDQLVTFLPIAWIGDFVQFAAAILSGASISAVENSGTVLKDLRQLAPDLLVAPISFYRRVLAKIETDVRHSSRFVAWLYQKSKALGEVVADRYPNQSEPGSIAPLTRWLLRRVFRSPLRNVIGLSRVRTAYCAEGVLPPELVSSFGSFGVKIRSMDIAPLSGGILDVYEQKPNMSANAIGGLDGIQLKQNSAGEVFCRSDHPAMGTLGNGRRLSPIKVDRVRLAQSPDCRESGRLGPSNSS